MEQRRGVFEELVDTADVRVAAHMDSRSDIAVVSDGFDEVVCVDSRVPNLASARGRAVSYSGHTMVWPEPRHIPFGEPLVWVTDVTGAHIPVVARCGTQLVVGGAITSDDALCDPGVRSWWLDELEGCGGDRNQLEHVISRYRPAPPGYETLTHVHVAHNTPPDACDTTSAVPHLVAELGADVLQALWQCRSGLRFDNIAPAVLISGCAVGDPGPTPPSPGVAVPHAGAAWTLAVANCVGVPYHFAAESSQVVQNLVPVRADAHEQTSTSSSVTLAWHTETAFTAPELRPRFVVLTCVRSDPGAATLIADIGCVRQHLDLRTIGVLREPRFRFRDIDPSFAKHAKHSAVGAGDRRVFPLLRGTWTHPTLCWDAELVEGVDPEARAAAETLLAAVDTASEPVYMEEGQVLVFDNTRVVHGRSAFTARFDGTDRWLLRCLVAGDDTEWGEWADDATVVADHLR